jgi:hypothetical protein
MKRLLLALAVNAALATPIVADYLVIRINLGADTSAPASNPTPGGGAPGVGGGGGLSLGGVGGGGAVGAPGGAPGGRPGLGGVGGGAAAPPPPNMGPGTGRGGGRPTPPPTGGGAGRQGKGGGRSADDPGAPAAPGGGFGGGVTAPGAGGQQGSEPTGFVANKGDLFITALEVNISKQQRGEKVILYHPWGTTVLNPETTLPNRAVMQVIPVKSLESRFGDKRRDFVDGTNKQYLKFAEWMLENWNLPFAEGKFNMQTRFENYLNEMSGVAGSLSPADKAKLDALHATRANLAKPVAPAGEEAEIVKAMLPKLGSDFRPMAKGHYVIFHQARDDKAAAAKIARLETAMAGILYWFALQGKPLQVPSQQIVCVLTDNAKKFQEIRALFDNVPLESDGFYSRVDNITILAPFRADAAFEKFDAVARAAEEDLRQYKLDFGKLLRENHQRPYVPISRNEDSNTTGGGGIQPPAGGLGGLGLGGGRGGRPGGRPGGQGQDQQEDPNKINAIITGQIFALAKQAALDEGEVTTATHEAFQHVAAANGFPPRSLILPRSVREGLASFFSCPKSSGDENLPALWSGIGGQHWIYQPLFRKLQEARKGGDKAEITIDEKLTTRRTIPLSPLDLIATVTDKNFDYADRAEKDDQEFMRDKARAEAWSLTYFLVKTRSDQFRGFIGELAQLPRDLELGGEVVELAFGRAFGLLDAKGEKLDNAKVTRLQKEWGDYMNTVNLEVVTADKAR